MDVVSSLPADSQATTPATAGTLSSSGSSWVTCGRLGEGDLAERGRTAAALDAWLVFDDEAGFSMTPPTTRTWSRRGHTPTVWVRGRSRRRLSVAALACHKPSQPSQLIHRPHADTRLDERKSFARTGYRDLIRAAHQSRLSAAEPQHLPSAVARSAPEPGPG